MKVPDLGWRNLSCIESYGFGIMELCSQFQLSILSLKVSRNLLKNDDTLLKFRRTRRFLTVAGSLNMFVICSFAIKKLKF